MIHPGEALPLCLASAAIMGSPGPATISVLAAGSAYGVRRSVRYAAGVSAGTAVVLVAVAGGITGALLAVPALRTVLTVVSVAYILWLAYRVATAPPLTGDAGAPAATFGGGALLGVANPKAWIAIAAVFSSVRLADAPAADAAAKVLVLTAMIGLIMSAWLLVGASVAPLLREPRRARAVNVALALALLAATALAVH
jgi:threonine/homoserine/homoserine lactone efflux protein